MITLLLWLFQRYGVPLLIKCDNGAAFIAERLAERLAEWLRPWQVILFFSPPRQPRDNGALERSNRTNKIYTASQAASQGHPFQWRRENLEAARHLANEITRPWGEHGPTAQETWDDRLREPSCGPASNGWWPRSAWVIWEPWQHARFRDSPATVGTGNN